MQEYWFCSRCKSMNRSAATSCYSCRAPREQFTLARQTERAEGTVLTPGLDDEHRAVAWALMARQTYVSSWRLGYLAAALLLLTLPLSALLWLLASRLVLQPDGGSSVRLDSVAYPLLIVAAAFFLVAVIIHSAFLAIASLDAPALGSGTPRFEPIRAALWWVESYLWALRAGLAFVIPPLLALGGLATGGFFFAGLVLGFIWMACAYMLLGDPIGSLAKPVRLLADLYVRSGVEGSSDRRIVSWWGFAWGTAQAITYAAAALVYVVSAVVIFAALVTGNAGSLRIDAGANGAEMMLVVVVGLAQTIAQGTSIALLAAITFEIATRQRIREAWVRGGPGGPQRAGR